MRLNSGENYTIRQLLCGDNDKIMIPDLQRDYCWGNPENNLVRGFVEGLLSLDKSQRITMGLIYGYYNAYTPEHLQLCDGQQRLTTIFLIMGVLNRKLGFSAYACMLMSSFELEEDDQEPYLQYAIRESSLYFLSDLTVNYFLKDGIDSSEAIDRQPWFLNEYRLDPTVCSMLSAIKTIEELLNDVSQEDLLALGDFIANKLEFLFYDMGTRENGEETFVIINTTGEPLSATQNLKPLVIDQNLAVVPDVAQRWEEMETWFWTHRNQIDTEYPHTAEEGMNCFLNLVRLLHCKSEEQSYETIEDNGRFPYKEISFRELYEVFLVYRNLYEMDFSERMDMPVRYPSKQSFFQQERIYAILPTMQYCLRFREAEDEDVKRIYHLFSNMARYRDTNRYKDNRTGSLYSPSFRAVQMIKDMPTKDYLSLASILDDRIDIKEEPEKMRFIESYQNLPEIRRQVELLFAKAENHTVLNGQIAVLVGWAESDMNRFRGYYQRFEALWNVEDLQGMDLLRRALLTRGMSGYPYSVTPNFVNFGNKNTWQAIVKNNSDDIRSFLEDSHSLQEMIDEFRDTKNKWYAFIKDGSKMQFSEYKNSYVYGDVVIDMKKERTSSDYMIVHRNTVFSKNLLSSHCGRWAWPWANEDCLWYDSNIYNLTLDLFFFPDGYRIVVWEGKLPHLKAFSGYRQLGCLGLEQEISGDWNGRWATPVISDGEEAMKIYMRIAEFVDNYDTKEQYQDI